jgi:hypothetical protein
MNYFYPFRALASFAAAFALWPVLASAQSFTTGNIVVARVGDGSAPLTAAAAAVFLDEYTTSGTLVQSISLPTSVNAPNRILTASGTATSELNMTRSADGHYLVLTGYSAATGTTAVVSSQSTDIARVIGLIRADGSFDTSTSTGDAFNTTSIRAAATIDGQSFYSVGGNSGVQYQALGSDKATMLNTAPTSIRSINIANGNLYISTNASPYVGLSQVGTGLPDGTSAQDVTPLPGFPATTMGASPYGFYFADMSADVPGVDVVYVTDDRTTNGGIQKWSLVAGSWVPNGTIASTATAALRGLNGTASAASVSLVASSSSGLFFLTDNAGYNTPPSTATLPAPIASANQNTMFRGLAFAPVAPAPAITSFTPATGGAGTTVTITGTNFMGATAVRIGSLDIPSYTVVSATTITLVLPAVTGSVNGFVTVVTPSGTAVSTSPFNIVLATLASQALPGLTVSPNPAADYLLVELPQAGPATAALRDLTGRLVLAPVALLPHQPLPLPAGLTAGIYLLEIQQGTVMAVRRVEKQ